MREHHRNLIFWLWAVIAALIIGSGVISGLLINKTNELESSNSKLNGNAASLRSQLRQARAQIANTTPTPDPGLTPAPVTTPEPGVPAASQSPQP